MADHVTVERDAHIATVTIDRPEKLNALNTQINDDLRDAFADHEDALAVVLQTAGDRAFVAGADLGEIRGLDGREFAAFQRNGRRTNDAIADHPAVVVAAVDGLAYGGGLELALAADVVVAGESATFAVPEVKLGLVPGGGATQRLPRAVGSNLATEMLTTGEPIDAERARTAGLANRVVPDEEVADVAADVAGDVCENAPLAVRAAKRLVNEGVEASLDTALSYEQEVTFTLYETEDATEGIEAFAEDREPTFTGE